MPTFKLLSSLNSNTKLEKSNLIQDTYLNVNMYMEPRNRLICPFQDEAGCKDPCLNTAGLGGVYPSVQQSRARKTDMYLNEYDTFMTLLYKDIDKFVSYCDKLGKLPAVRLNGTSDIQWEHKKHEGLTVFEKFPDVQFYDYTKIPNRKVSHIKNYHLTWSYSEASDRYADYFDQVMYNKAVVFNLKKSEPLPKTFKGLEVIDGDTHDMRFLDKPNKVVGLRAKGKAKTDDSGFVIQPIKFLGETYSLNSIERYA